MKLFDLIGLAFGRFLTMIYESRLARLEAERKTLFEQNQKLAKEIQKLINEINSLTNWGRY